MKRFILLPLVAFVLAACEQATEPEKVAVPPAVQSSAAAQDYTVIDLGTLGGNSSAAFAINDRSQIVGQSRTTSGAYHAFLWDNGVMTDLGTLGNSYTRSTAFDINARGQVVGTTRTSDWKSRAFLWENGVMKDLGTLGGEESVAYAINNGGQVVGSSQTADGAVHAFLWQLGVMTDLGTAGGGFSSWAEAINESGRVVGMSSTADGTWPACLWDKGGVTVLGDLEDANALAINNRGQVVGEDAAIDQAVLWEKGVASYLVPGAEWSIAEGINDLGLVIGDYSIPGGGGAFLWDNGVITDFGSEARFLGVNNRGQVVGMSRNSSGEFHATLWTR